MCTEQNSDIIRVLRTIEYIGPRADVAKQISNSIHGDRRGLGQCLIRVGTVGSGAGDVPASEELLQIELFRRDDQIKE